MSMRSWIRSLFTRPAPRPIRKAPRRTRLALEVLEDRWVPATFTVNSTGDTGAGSNLAGDLRYCITQANLGGNNTIQFDPTVFNSAQTINLTGAQLKLSDKTGTETITGPAGVTISGGGLSRVFQVNAMVDAIISGLTITGGAVGNYGGGGGLYNNGTLTLTNCTVSSNSAYYGGGLYNNGTATLTNCIISGNSASQGSGLQNNGTLMLTNCNVSDNTAESSGGGLNNSLNGTATLTNCTISGNTSPTQGGGIDNNNRLTLTNCTVSGNTAGSTTTGNGGGGLWCESDYSTTLTNCTISGNTASDGGGLLSYAAPVTLINCTIGGNTAGKGGGININTAGLVTIGNTIVAGNTATKGPDVSGAVIVPSG